MKNPVTALPYSPFAIFLSVVACSGNTEPSAGGGTGIPGDANGDNVLDELGATPTGSPTPTTGTGGGTSECAMVCTREKVQTITVQGDGWVCSADEFDPNNDGYPGGSRVSHQGKIYQSLWWSNMAPPGTDGGWVYVEDCVGGGTSTKDEITYEEYCCDEVQTDPPHPDAGCVLDKYFANGKADFDYIMQAPWQNPSINTVFSDAYNQLCIALEDPGFSNFASKGTEEQNKREIAAFLANVAVETAYLQDSAQMGDYSSEAFTVGRGAIQLTYDYNYQAAADYLGDQSIMSKPSLVATDEQLVWKTALWFWLHYSNLSTSAPNNCHEAILAGDFGKTLRIIKGDCGSLDARILAYNKGVSRLGTTAGMTTCSQ